MRRDKLLTSVAGTKWKAADEETNGKNEGYWNEKRILFSYFLVFRSFWLSSIGINSSLLLISLFD